ncbi:hypothetical protein D9613_005883 [Agrocybe pediades]|uniref:F-box domain-containing protein n=1 Tax=Agrocybe pediades TaxID=84607 RepID=A0A8H4QUJ4_9AGAR|nr:hypothetical protein D9613_005883 [Agrocybe pediades]
MLTLSSLPVDVVILIFESLGIREFVALSMTCHDMYTIVSEYGWSSYLRYNPRPANSLTKARNQWPPRVRARYDIITDSTWDHGEFIARPLSRIWNGKLQPILASSQTRLIVSAGSNLYSYAFGTDTSFTASPPIISEGALSLLNNPDRPRNITALSFIDDGDLDETLDVGFQDGALERIKLIPSKSEDGSPILSCIRSRIDPMPNGDFVESLSSESNIILALSSNGYARLSSNGSGSPNSEKSIHAPSSIIELNTRSWVSHLCLQASTPYAAFGTASTTPLNVHALTDGGQLSPQPLAILHTQKTAGLTPDNFPSSAVYGLSSGPLNAPWGSSPQIIVSGWFDGQVRCYDLRSSSRVSLASATDSTTQSGPAPLRPVLSLADRWSYEPIYSVSCGGGSAAHIAAGTARHSVVSFWDVRSPKKGWSVHAPGNDPSPVYSIILESSRFFGATQSRPFVYDFGPGVSLDTYPHMPQVRGVDNLKHKKGSNRATYHVLRYDHNSSGLCNEN